MPSAADPESTLGHYNKERGSTKLGEWRAWEGDYTGVPSGEAALTQSSVSVTPELQPTGTRAHTGQAGTAPRGPHPHPELMLY